MVPGFPPLFKMMEFLWVRWFEYDYQWKAGLKQQQLHHLRFTQEGDHHAYGFLDPDDVIHGTHLIPAFTQGQSNGDYNYFYINM